MNDSLKIGNEITSEIVQETKETIDSPKALNQSSITAIDSGAPADSAVELPNDAKKIELQKSDNNGLIPDAVDKAREALHLSRTQDIIDRIHRSGHELPPSLQLKQALQRTDKNGQNLPEESAQLKELEPGRDRELPHRGLEHLAERMRRNEHPDPNLALYPNPNLPPSVLQRRDQILKTHLQNHYEGQADRREGAFQFNFPDRRTQEEEGARAAGRDRPTSPPQPLAASVPSLQHFGGRGSGVGAGVGSGLTPDRNSHADSRGRAGRGPGADLFHQSLLQRELQHNSSLLSRQPDAVPHSNGFKSELSFLFSFLFQLSFYLISIIPNSFLLNKLYELIGISYPFLILVI